MSPRASLLLLSTLLSVACASQPQEVSSPEALDGDPGTLSISFRNGLKWPYRLERLVVVLDGRPLYSVTQPKNVPVTLGRESVVEGNHVLAAQISLSYPSGALRETCVLRIRESKMFRVDHSVAQAVIEVKLQSMTHDFMHRPQFIFHLRGTLPATSVDDAVSAESQGAEPPLLDYDFHQDIEGCRGDLPLDGNDDE